jgi:hypothetical protein
MKRIIFIFALLLVAVSLSAQRVVTTAASGSTITLGPVENSVKVTPTAADTVGGTATKYWVFAIDKPSLQLWSIVTNIDTIKKSNRVEGNRVRMRILGSLDNSTYVQIGSSIFYNVNAGTNADSTFAVSDVSTGVLWKYLKVEYTGVVAAKCSKPTTLILKVAEKK